MSDKWKKHREVARNAVAPHSGNGWQEWIAERVMDALATAGLLRSSPWVESESEERIAQLESDLATSREATAAVYAMLADMTRERDEARASAKFHRDYCDSLGLATAASPEVMRVVEAAKAYKRDYPARLTVNGETALMAAVHALEASRQPKAQEPRYVVCKRDDTTFPWMVCPRNSNALSIWIDKTKAEAECARLNGEGE